MKIKNLVSPVLLLGIIFTLVLSPSLVAQKKEPQQRATIPPEVKSVLNDGIETRQVRSDIPFSIMNNYYLPDFPTRQELHSIFLFKVKNSDLGFTSISPAPKKPEKKEEKSQTHFAPFAIFFFSLTGWKIMCLEKWSRRSTCRLDFRSQAIYMNRIRKSFTQPETSCPLEITSFLWPSPLKN